MPQTSAPILFQRLQPLFPALFDPGLNPVLRAGAVVGQAVEGETVTFRVTKVGNLASAVSFTWTVSSEAGNSDFVDSPTGSDTIPSGESVVVVSIRTVQRTGAQNNRVVTFTLNSAVNASIDPVFLLANTTVVDYTAPSGIKWWKQLPYRSGRPWAGGHGYSATNEYSAQVAYRDGFGAPFGGSDSTRNNTMLRIAGGPLNNPNSFDSNGQLAWNTSDNFWSIPWFNHAKGFEWAAWMSQFISFDIRTDGDNKDGAWNSINAGVYDQHFRDMGARLMININNNKFDPKFFLIRMNHEMQHTNSYRIFQGTKEIFRSAHERMIDMVREGANYNLRFMFSPSRDRIYQGEDFGALGSWCPSNADGISMSFHPGPPSNSEPRSTFTRVHLNGTASTYGCQGDVLNLAIQKGWPVSFLEWGPRHDSNQNADEIHDWFFTDFLMPNRDNICVDLAFGSYALNKDAAQEVGNTAGDAAWRLGVDKFIELWGGKRVDRPDYVNPVWPTVIPPGAAPANITVPVVSGNATVGSTVSCTQGTWTQNPTSFAYQWRADGVNISLAFGTTFVITDAQLGKHITCTVTATNASGSGFVMSTSVGPVISPVFPYVLPVTEPSFAGAPTISVSSSAALQTAINNQAANTSLVIVLLPGSYTSDVSRILTDRTRRLKLLRSTKIFTKYDPMTGVKTNYSPTGALLEGSLYLRGYDVVMHEGLNIRPLDVGITGYRNNTNFTKHCDFTGRASTETTDQFLLQAVQSSSLDVVQECCFLNIHYGGVGGSGSSTSPDMDYAYNNFSSKDVYFVGSRVEGLYHQPVAMKDDDFSQMYLRYDYCEMYGRSPLAAIQDTNQGLVLGQNDDSVDGEPLDRTIVRADILRSRFRMGSAQQAINVWNVATTIVDNCIFDGAENTIHIEQSTTDQIGPVYPLLTHVKNCQFLQRDPIYLSTRGRGVLEELRLENNTVPAGGPLQITKVGGNLALINRIGGTASGFNP